ncbi:NmrA family NAD(P)-binding protein [Flavobacterium subsaxonicum]|uniref:NAD-dependent dehydratase n=1 Tax=Flavobacterium subsaxonicum WB 4.1-42 = DSM 21790 TaxID=1121898 RepID=A0A0A2MKR5_9FLAO|nr:NAD(P)H-binding protein [Flavobacterium subsaxonicum]KGO93212.1 NAD-dependent dehydratase [Flavobacterium subsaxonicum WB 4.1-42 = DSM 21790]
MKIIVTGSIGHISKPLTQQLISEGHNVIVISSNAERQADIEALGATAAIGSLRDVDFLTATFTGADAVYTMVPPNNYFNHSLDLLAYYRGLGTNYAQAISQSGVKRVVNLSTIGAHLEKGSGILFGAHNVEKILNALPAYVAITHMRPVSFYYNLYGYTDMIKNASVIAANYGADRMIPWVSPIDIAAAVAEELVTPFDGRKVRYVASEELTGHESAAILGAAIGKPDLQWVLISDEETLNGLTSIGMAPQIAAGLVEMYGSLYTGLLSEDYVRNRPAVMGKVKLADFAKEFATAFKQN